MSYDWSLQLAPNLLVFLFFSILTQFTWWPQKSHLHVQKLRLPGTGSYRHSGSISQEQYLSYSKTKKKWKLFLKRLKEAPPPKEECIFPWREDKMCGWQQVENIFPVIILGTGWRSMGTELYSSFPQFLQSVHLVSKLFPKWKYWHLYSNAAGSLLK